MTPAWHDHDSPTVTAGILRGTQVRTLDGNLPVEFLEPGDRIITRSDVRRLLSLALRHHAMLPVVSIAASTQAHDRPENDLLVAPSQPLVIRDWRARAMFGQPVAIIPAARLVDGHFVRSEVLAQATLFSLRFAEDEVIWAEGLELACPAQETAAA